jgi:hypothetical protein
MKTSYFYSTMRRYKFLFEDGKTFSVVASSISQAESYLISPVKLVSIDKLYYGPYADPI